MKHATANYKRLKPFLLGADANEGYFRYTSEGYEPLSVERIGYSFKGLTVYSMMHTYVQYGDLMRDPEMTFAVDDAAGTVEPLTYQLDAMGMYQEVYPIIDGKRMFSRRLQTDLDDFAATWSRNIIAQGFDPAQAYKDR